MIFEEDTHLFLIEISFRKFQKFEFLCVLPKVTVKF